MARLLLAGLVVSTLGATGHTAREADGASGRSGASAASASAATDPQDCTVATPGHAACQYVLDKSGRADLAKTMAVSAPSFGYGPAHIRSAYGLDQTRGGGQTIAVVTAYSSPRTASDLAVYRAAWKLPACTVANRCLRMVNQRGTTTMPAANVGWGLETALDLDAVSAACPNCKLLLVAADSNSYENLAAAVNRAVAMGATVVSNSYGGDEWSGMATLGKAYTHPGVAILASSGDNGYGRPSFPAIWPSVIAVGGTSLSRSSTGVFSEKAWSGSGSGCSLYVAKPAYQKQTSCTKRLSSDVSAVADPNTGLAVYNTYGYRGWVMMGGTSLATPLMAGMVGLAGNASVLTSAAYIYAHTSGLYDVRSGSNGSCGGTSRCTSMVGQDGPTGAGSPRGLSAL